jgi:hypothetical protein
MIALTAAATSVLTRSHRTFLAVESWRGDVLLADDVPVSDATEEGDRSGRVPERLTLTVPRMDRGVSWSPDGPDHPLAAAGQQLRVKLGIGLAGAAVEWFQRGVFLITECRPSGDTVNVTAAGLLELVDEADLIQPFQPTGTLVSTVRGLVEPALTVVVTGLTDRAVPVAGINWDEDRLGALLELLDAWPATAYVDPAGYLQVVTATQSTVPALAVTDGAGGTVREAAGVSTREGAYNVVVARGAGADGAQIQGIAYDFSGGPTSYGGPFNPLPVPYFFFSPLLTTVAQCTEAAGTILARLRRDAGRRFQVEMVPHPGVQAGDVISLTSEALGLSALACSVEEYTLPYLPGDAMRLTVQELS